MQAFLKFWRQYSKHVKGTVTMDLLKDVDSCRPENADK